MFVFFKKIYKWLHNCGSEPSAHSFFFKHRHIPRSRCLKGGAVVIADVEQGRHRRGVDGFPHGAGVEDLGMVTGCKVTG